MKNGSAGASPSQSGHSWADQEKRILDLDRALALTQGTASHSLGIGRCGGALQAVVVLLWLCLCSALADGAEPGAVAGYVGSSSCRECHQHFYSLWAPSHHGLAMQPYSAGLAKTNLVAQKDPIRVGDATYQADLVRGAVLEKGPRGEKSYRIEQVMGGKNVFYFLTALDRGRLQVLPVAFDVRHRQWFDMPASAVRHFGGAADAPLDWREPQFTFNTACYNCHVSQLSSNYDPAQRTYHTAWAEPGINCETCHGPGAQHIAAARALPKGAPFTDLKLIVTSTFSHDQMNSLCASCHAKMYPLAPSFTPGASFFDHYGLTGLEDPDFYPDGRDLGENFTETTWRLSPCRASGKLDCVHCHTSSGRYRFAGEKSNQACLPCHQSQVDKVAAHSHHPAGSTGAQCVACHMPTTEFARMRRSDHSMRPPAPSATVAFGSPNACNLCHQDKTAAWSDKYVRQWQSHDYQVPLLQRASWIAAARKQDWSKLAETVAYLASTNREETWAASLLELLRPCSNPAKWDGILPCLKDPSPWVRAAALDACGDDLRPEFIERLVAATTDPVRLVRIRAAAALAPVPRESLPQSDRAQLERATAEFQASLQARPDDSASQYNLGNFFMERREFEKATAAFAVSHELRPDSLPPLVNASLAYSTLGANDRAEACLREALHLEPTNAVANLNFGMLMAELGKLPEAEKAFRTAFRSDPKSAPAAYNLGVLLAKEKPDQAVDWCRKAASLRPDEPKYSYTLAYFLAQKGDADGALSVLADAAAQHHITADGYALLGGLWEQLNDKPRALAAYRQAADDKQMSEPVRQQFAAKVRELESP